MKDSVPCKNIWCPNRSNEGGFVGEYCSPCASNPFKVGDIVRRRSGSSPIVVKHVLGSKIVGRYSRSLIETNGYEPAHKFTLFEDKTEDQSMENDMNTLYEITLSETNTVYGHKLAVNSKNEWVMEPKGGGQVFTVDPSKVKEVLPYTVTVMFGYGNSAKYDYLAEVGEFEVGDHLWEVDPPTAIKPGFTGRCSKCGKTNT